MHQVLIVIHLLIVLALVGVILMQRSEGGALGGLGGGGGVSGFLTGRGQANALTRVTAILAAAFFATSIMLAIAAGTSRAPRSILDGAAPTAVPGAPAAPSGGGQGILDELQQLQNQKQQDAQPGPPESPATPQVPGTR